MNPTKAPPAIMSLPPEILSRIFILSIQVTQTDKLNPRKPRLKLISVCRGWKEIACNTSELWSTCWLSYKATDLNICWLSRTSKECLLELDGLRTPWTTNEAQRGPGSSIRLLNSILSFIPQCRSLSVDSDLFNSKELEPNQQPQEIDALHLLHASFLGRSLPSWFLAVLCGAPNLQSLVIDLALSFPTNTTISFSNLTSLTVRRLYSVDRLLSVLENSPKLQHLSVSGPMYRQGTLRIVTLHSLTSFTLSFAEDVGILETLRFPLLQSLEISSRIRGFYPDDIPQLFNFFQRSQCTLQELVIDSHDAGTILSVLEQPAICSSLKVLSCPNAWADEGFFALMNNTAMLPRLCSLKVGHTFEKCIPLLIDMLYARRRRNDRGAFVEHSCLERVELTSGFMDVSIFEPDAAVAGVCALAEELGIVLDLPYKGTQEFDFCMTSLGLRAAVFNLAG